MELHSLLASTLNIARDVGKRVLRIYQDGNFQQQLKADSTPVTSADMDAHQTLITKLLSLTPDIPVLSEEDADIPFAIRKHWECYWLVDPLDGTQEFISGTGEFATSIALVVQNKAVLGVVYYPMKDRLYYAITGSGAWKQTGNDSPQPLSVQKHQASDPSLTLTISRRQNKGKTLQYFSKGWDPKIIYYGSACLKSCLVAEGKADCYLRIGLTAEWDTAAVQCIVTEAGGALVDLNWQPLTYNKKVSLTNPNFIVTGDTRLPWKEILAS